MQFMRVALLSLLVAGTVNAKLASAQDSLVRVALFKTAADDGSLADLAAALDPVVSSELGEVSAVQITARPALDLPSMQLAIDCVGETTGCLGASATQADADALVAPSLQRDGDAIVFTLLHFDPAIGSPRTVHRRYEGDNIGEQALSGVGGMLVELFGEDSPPAQPEVSLTPVPAPESTGPQPLAAPPSEASSRGLPIASIALGGLGVALIGTSVAFGLMSNASYDGYREIHPRTYADADRAMGKLDDAKGQATVSNITLGVGAATLVGAGVLLFWQLKERKSEPESRFQATLAPRVGPREAGLTVVAVWNDCL
jgi:hypothetical protein